MMRRVFVAALAVLFAAGLAVAADMKEASGTVKAVTVDSVTVTDAAAKDWTFVVDKETSVEVSGGSHKMDRMKADGKPTTITEFVAVKKPVSVKYVEKDGKMYAKEVRVK
jgi:hypothetical protein